MESSRFIMSPQEREYYRERAAAEKLRAADATHMAAADIHHTLACLYEKLVELEEEPTAYQIVTPDQVSA